MTDEVSTSVKLPTFDGKSENFAMWWIRFQAFATVKIFGEALVWNTNLPASKAKADLLDPTDSSNKDVRTPL